MAWFLTLQGPQGGAGQSPTYELHESVNIERVAEELSDAVAADRPVAVPAVLHSGRHRVTLYIRPAAWGAWAFYQMTEEERREMIAANPLISAIAQAQAAKQQPRPQQYPTGPSMIPRLD